MSAEVDSVAPETVANPDYAGDETASLLVRMAVGGMPPSGSQTQNQEKDASPAKNGTKPMLIRQDCTTSRLSVSPRPLLSASGGIGYNGSEESATGVAIEESGVRSVPDLEMHCRMSEGGVSAREGGSGGMLFHRNGASNPRLRGSSVSSYNHLSPYSRCRCEQGREPHSRLPRSVSRESVRSVGNQQGYQCAPHSVPPPVLLTTTPSNSRVIRQSSQPESTTGE